MVMGQPGQLEEWRQLDQAVASSLVEVECFRTLDRFRLREQIQPADLTARYEAMHRLVERLRLIELDTRVLRRAAQPLPVPLTTLDAIHLATAMLWMEADGVPGILATHDAALGRAGRAVGFRVLGVLT